MANPKNQGAVQNRLLASLSPEDFGLLEPHLVSKLVESGDLLIEAGTPIANTYFPESSAVSLVSTGETMSEVALIGREGFAGTPVVLGTDQMPLRALCQMPGDGFSIAASAIVDAIGRSASLRQCLLRFTHVLFLQTSSTVYANANFTVEQRLARWLLMAHDRSSGDELRLTHDFLATMLCVRRPGVTVATHVLEGHRMIRAQRGRITVIDRDKLKEFAGDSYGTAEAEYARLFGPVSRHLDVMASASRMQGEAAAGV